LKHTALSVTVTLVPFSSPAINYFAFTFPSNVPLPDVNSSKSAFVANILFAVSSSPIAFIKLVYPVKLI
jgi:hypothetical protein